MVFKISESDVAAEERSSGIFRRRLLDTDRVPSARLALERIELQAGATMPIGIAAGDLGWFLILTGSVELRSSQGSHELDDSHVVFLPPAFLGQILAARETALIFADVPNAAGLDPGFADAPTSFRIIDWRREPVLNSQNDARKRIYLATPKLFGNKAMKSEMIIYPPDTTGANHHHVGADHFMYFLAGGGTAFANEAPLSVSKGDVVYFFDGERHYLTSDEATEMIFVEFFAPGEYETVWEKGTACSWAPTGRDIQGNAPVREIRSHSGKDPVPEDV